MWIKNERERERERLPRKKCAAFFRLNTLGLNAIISILRRLISREHAIWNQCTDTATLVLTSSENSGGKKIKNKQKS